MSKILIFSGDDTVSSRKAYIARIEELKKEYQVDNVNSKEITEDLLENIFGSKDLFGKGRGLATESLLSGQKSKNKDKLFERIAILKDYLIIDWEEKEVSKTAAAKLGKDAILKNFKLPALIFKFLDELSPSNINQNLQSFHQIILSSDAGFVFSMIIRQFRLMILAIDGQDESLPIWQKSKLKNQANFFGKEKLLLFYKKLLEIDFRQKTSSSPFDLSGELDLFIANF